MLRLATVLVALLPLVASAATTTLKISTLYPDAASSPSPCGSALARPSGRG